MSTARPDTWMPLYWGDYLRDTLHLRAEGHGAYLLLIAAYWTSGGPLPDDDEQLAAITRLEAKAWRKLKPTLAKFFDVEDGQWRQGRVDIELERANHITKVRQTAGKAGGKKSAKVQANAKQTDKQNATQSQPHISKPSSLDIVHSDFDAAWERWPRKQQKQPALKAYLKAREKTSPEKIEAGIGVYIRNKPDYEDWCHFATWLNKERWNDEPHEDVGNAKAGRGSTSAEDQEYRRKRGILDGLGLTPADFGPGAGDGGMAHGRGMDVQYPAIGEGGGGKGDTTPGGKSSPGDKAGNGTGVEQTVHVRGGLGQGAEEHGRDDDDLRGGSRGSAGGSPDAGDKPHDQGSPVEYAADASGDHPSGRAGND